MKAFLAAPALALAVGGCTTLTGPTVVDTLAEVCRYEPLAYVAFSLFAPQASPEVRLRVDQAHAIVQQTCIHPPVDAYSAFQLAYASYLIVYGATP